MMLAVVRSFRRLLDRVVLWRQGWCQHRALRYVADAWDYEYICSHCEKRWFNERPACAETARLDWR